MADVFIEAGAKKVFASALAWPGWARSARDEDGALDALRAYARRYKKVVPSFVMPKRLDVIERVKGDANTDFGVPSKVAAYDLEPIIGKELQRQLAIMRACWKAFDAAVKSARGKTLATGPRGGGRDVDAMAAHVAEGERSYLIATAGRTETDDVRASMLDAVARRARGELPDAGPRGGRRFPARYAIRRSAWHVLDHLWELEDRS